VQYPILGLSSHGIISCCATNQLESAHVEKTIWSEKSQHLREALAKARKDAKLTQAELAEKLKRPQSFVAKYEGGERRLDLVEFIWVCKALKIAPEKLFLALLKA
jgi:predicted transcriptional regulator